LPWDLGRLYYRHGSPGHEQIFMSVMMELCDDKRQIITNAHPLVEIALSLNDNGDYILSLVNSSGHQSTSFFDPIPMSNIEVRGNSSSLPHSVTSAQSLRLNKELPLSNKEGYICFTLDQLELFDTIVMRG